MRSNSATLAAQLPWDLKLPWHHRRLVDHIARLRRGTLTVTLASHRPFTLHGPEDGPTASITIVRPAALMRRLFWRGDLGFAESYLAHEWETPDLARLLELLAVNLDAYDATQGRNRLSQAWVGLRHWAKRNTRRGSKRNISAHYDLGNDFYTKWLDPSMTYSSAVYQRGDSLETAQERKYARMLDLLGATPGEHILEIGCGWGGFAEFAARRGLRVTGLTLSTEQLDYAQQRMTRAGLQDRVDLRLCDYRDVDITVDHVVSIEMFEAVGREYWTGYFETLQRVLRPGGRAALQVITIDEAQFEEYAATPGGFIQSYIFPGGMLPTKTHLQTLGDGVNLKLQASRAYGIDYADTLAEWHQRFNAQRDWLEAHGYDDRFRRMWRYYLAFCEAGFRARRIDVVQCCYQKG